MRDKPFGVLSHLGFSNWKHLAPLYFRIECNSQSPARKYTLILEDSATVIERGRALLDRLYWNEMYTLGQ